MSIPEHETEAGIKLRVTELEREVERLTQERDTWKTASTSFEEAFGAAVVEQDEANRQLAAAIERGVRLYRMAHIYYKATRRSGRAWELAFDRVEQAQARVEERSRQLAAVVERAEKLAKALGHAIHLTEHNKANCVRCREARKHIDTALCEEGK